MLILVVKDTQITLQYLTLVCLVYVSLLVYNINAVGHPTWPRLFRDLSAKQIRYNAHIPYGAKQMSTEPHHSFTILCSMQLALHDSNGIELKIRYQYELIMPLVGLEYLYVIKTLFLRKKRLRSRKIFSFFSPMKTWLFFYIRKSTNTCFQINV